ncbi:hypothetical protein [Microbacterium paraoxydans]|uniref:hypothetical protein n=1 Tax=Microbacterium paraoxydans TaxID=199592 RepID=UPI001C2C842D|nr:hypothetical protein [Microbacterium paraoxydans]QXE28553.1 hypothetical protein IZR02_09010 [Microbacterium paraoxydans]
MSKRFEIDIGLNASGVAKGAKDGQKALSDLEAAVDGVGAESSRAGGPVDSFASKLVEASRKAGKSDDDIKDALRGMGLSARQAERAVEGVGDGLKDAGRDGERALDGIEDSLRDVQRRSEDAFDDIGDSSARGFQKAEEGVKGLKDEAMQSARETAASFDGSFESIAELGQEVAANAFADFGPAGAAAGLAVAAAAGVMVNHFNEVQEAADEARESAFGLAYDVAGALSAAGYTERIAAWTSETEKYKQVLDLANVSEWDRVDVIDALASGGDKLDRLTEAFASNGMTTSVTSGRVRELEAVLKATEEGYLSGSDAVRLNERALYEFATTAGVATGEVDEVGNAIYRLPDETEVAINAATQRATEDIKRVEGDINAVPDSHTTTFNAQVTGLDKVRVDLDALTRPRTMTVTARLNAGFANHMGWDK